MEAKGLEKKKLRSEILNYALEASEFGRLFKLRFRGVSNQAPRIKTMKSFNELTKWIN